MTAAHPYPRVEQPLDVGPVRLRNRIVRAASGAGIARGVVNDDLVAYHRARAEGGVALTILGDGGVHRTANGCFELWRDDFVDGYRRLADECRAHGMVLFQELSHQGSAAVTGEPAWAPSPLANAMTGEIPRSMTQAMIDEVVEAFAGAAARCRRAGLEGVEVHAAHGFLAGQFLSPSTNIREDAYGGDLEGRSRFLRELLVATRHAVGPGFPVGVRLSATELVAGGITVDETCEVVELLQAEDLVDFVDISVGTLATYPTIIGGLHEPHGYQLAEARPVARACRVPTIVTGRIHTLAEAERILAAGTADLVSMVRPTIADAYLVAKSLAGREAEVRPCIACNECLRSMLGPLRRIGCAVAPAVGAGDVEAFEPAATPRSVLVAGGGPAG
ncbi:MAG: hypothetical protein JWO68_49, partial [Actinomycetia bacterium]|nr:hypothetical protein [Actinomycetes bacterium]